MLRIDIPGFGSLKLKYLVSDFTGTLSKDGKLLPGIASRLNKLVGKLEIHVLSSDTFGTAQKELRKVNCAFHLIEGSRVDLKKEGFVRRLGRDNVVAIGNGNNDRKMLGAARLGVAVIGTEGAGSPALKAADVCVQNPFDALDLLLKIKRCKATLRF